ncbi:RNI-like protein [Basidiobolus meristosporus CBS 931.73]|uniref:RNI-like protein n=1 Tax=Basidiobolus meristosporus CBS 931.73 TaxID=1314790 RepID=A0A1Y1YRK6_9FUNG|nr:RNI-like protein [Basidiobolus meristosporus CBS 931.73]|eukprot:ORY00195.1 RNI-like protein [Basidiobolus meristosporus CBS 931.73]
MAWGNPGPSPADEWVKKLETNDPAFRSLHILSFRRISQPDFQRIFAALGKNTVLSELYLSGHRLESDTLKVLSDALATNKALQRLNVGHNEFGSDENASNFQVLCEGLKRCEGLRNLDLENKGIGAKCAQILGHTLAVNKSLVELNLSRNQINDVAMEALCESLGDDVMSLEKLDLSANEISYKGAASLAKLLVDERVRLTELVLSENPLGAKGGAEIAKVLGQNQRLSVLKIAFIDQESADFQVVGDSPGDAVLSTLAESLDASSNFGVRSLWMDGCRISHEGAINLAKIIKHTRLEEIRLRSNQVGDEGVRYISQAISEPNSTIRKLELGENGITTIGFEALLSANALEYLGLFNNKVDFANGVPSTEITVPLANLLTLDLGCNNISTESFTLACQTLISGFAPSLRTLEMGGNLVDGNENVWEEWTEKVKQTREMLNIMWKQNLQNQNQP